MSLAFNVTTCRSRRSSSYGRGSRRAARATWVLEQRFRRPGDATAQLAVPRRARPARQRRAAVGGGSPSAHSRSKARASTPPGLIPPVRDATGVVDYRGNDVDIALSSGTVYLPSGRTVAASNGTLAIKKANVPPVIGALDIDVAGEAPAVAELASYDPINAMRYRRPGGGRFHRPGLRHTSRPTSRCKRASTARSSTGWWRSTTRTWRSPSRSTARWSPKPTARSQSKRRNAVIAAKAKLNGVPAEIDAVEPLAPGRHRNASG